MKILVAFVSLICLRSEGTFAHMYGRCFTQHNHGSPGNQGNSGTTTVDMAAGSSKEIASTRFTPHTQHEQTQTWNVQSPGSTLTANCWVHFPGQGCDGASLTVNGNRVCGGVGHVGPMVAESSLQISYSTRGGRRGFKCGVVASNAGPEQRPSSYPACGGSSQSPINIETSSLIGEFPWKELGVHGYDNPSSSLTLKNTGRAAVLETDGPFVMGGNLTTNVRYLLRSVTFHWGSSEHSVDGTSFAGEVQLVHYNSKYGSFEAALGQPDGLVALSVLLQISQYDNNNLKPVMDALGNVQSAGSATGIAYFALRNLLPGNIGDFYRYEGSLTSPGCEESVTWTVFKEPIGISSTQLDQFRQLKDESGNSIYSNIRPVQNLNGRSVSGGQVTPSWSHHGPDGQDVWASRISASCGGMKQSPVSIETALTVVESSWSPLVFKNFNQAPESMTLENNDHGAVIMTNEDFKATIVGGPFQTPYAFFHYHFHFGSPTTDGSEHTVDGRRYAGEIHMLIYKESLGGFGPAFSVEGATLEVSIFLELSQYDNPKLDSVIRGLESIVPSLSKTNMTPFPLENLLPNNRQDYFFYDGSFTAPGPTCTELSNFMLFREPIPISRNQISRFYNLESATGFKITNNVRRLQNLNGRTIFRSP